MASYDRKLKLVIIVLSKYYCNGHSDSSVMLISLEIFSRNEFTTPEFGYASFSDSDNIIISLYFLHTERKPIVRL